MFIAANFPFSALTIEFLPSDVMHGEGNLLAHLVIIGYKIPYQQVVNCYDSKQCLILDLDC